MSKHAQDELATSTTLSKGLVEEKVGYKQTKLGLIPEDWSIKCLNEIGEFSKGKGIAKKDILDDEIDGLPCVRYAEIYTRYHNYTTSLKSKINQESAESSNPIEKGDILFTGSGETLEEIGKSVAYLGTQTAYAGGDINILKQQNQDSQYLGYLFNTDVVRSQLFKIGQGHSVVHIYSSGLKKVLVPLPPLPEQQKIASILCTWDKAIAAQERLISEKQKIKKGLMQKLLTGKKRYPGFTEEWGEVRVKDIAKLITKGTTPTSLGYSFLDEGINFIKAESISKSGFVNIAATPKISLDCDKVLKRSRLRENDIVFSIAGTLGRTAIITKKDLPANTNQALSIIRLKDGQDIEFINFCLNTDSIKKYIQAMVSVGAQPNINLQQVGNIKLNLPGRKEQLKIVESLKNLENNLFLDNQRMGYMKKQKQGLMQQLLTGEKRVKL